MQRAESPDAPNGLACPYEDRLAVWEGYSDPLLTMMLFSILAIALPWALSIAAQDAILKLFRDEWEFDC